MSGRFSYFASRADHRPCSRVIRSLAAATSAPNRPSPARPSVSFDDLTASSRAAGLEGNPYEGGRHRRRITRPPGHAELVVQAHRTEGADAHAGPRPP